MGNFFSKIIRRSSVYRDPFYQDQDAPCIDVSYAEKHEVKYNDIEVFHVQRKGRLSGNKEFGRALARYDRSKYNSIKKVTLNDNEHITAVPSNIALFTNLTCIDLRNNSISELPWSIICLKHLSEFYLALNYFQSIPRIVCHIKTLKILDFSYNPLTHLPHELLYLENLEHLYLLGCEDLESASKDLCSKELDEIKTHLRKRGKRVNKWASSTPWYTDENVDNDDDHSFKMKSLFDLSVNCILNCDVDFLAVHIVPPLVKVHLENEVKNAERIQVCKCNTCSRVFSNSAIFNAHTCK